MRRLWRYAAIRSSFEPRLTSFMRLKGEKNLNKTCNTSILVAGILQIDVRDPHMFRFRRHHCALEFEHKPDRALSFSSLNPRRGADGRHDLLENHWGPD